VVVKPANAALMAAVVSAVWLHLPRRIAVQEAVAVVSKSLRARRERPVNRRAAEQRDELAPFHSITSSARPSSIGGISRPSVLAVLRLMIK
jgi:hypothetical protein